MRPLHTLISASLLAACGPGPTTADADAPDLPDADDAATGLPALGDGTHDLSNVHLDVVLTADDGLARPTDLAFHHETADQLWITNQGVSGMVVGHDVSDGVSKVDTFRDRATGTHFMARPSGLAFGKPGFFATSQEEDRKTQPITPKTFMGPTLWTSDLAEFDAGHASHYDMLHNSPNSVGIAWERGNAYWIYDGWNASLTRYDFAEDHGPGGSDHSDGIVRRYADGEMGYLEGVPCNMVYQRKTRRLFAVDAANARVVVLDTTSGDGGGRIDPNHDGIDQAMVLDADLDDLVLAEDLGMNTPSGLALFDGLLYVGDHATGRIAAITTDGELVDWVDTGIEDALGGLTVADDGSIWVVDMAEDRVLRISPVGG